MAEQLPKLSREIVRQSLKNLNLSFSRDKEPCSPNQQASTEYAIPVMSKKQREDALSDFYSRKKELQRASIKKPVRSVSQQD